MKSKRIQLGKPFFGKQHLNQPLKIETWKPDLITKKWTVGKLLNFRSFNFFMFPPDFLKMLQLNHLMLQLNHVMLRLNHLMLQLNHLMLQLNHLMLQLNHLMLQLNHLIAHFPFLVSQNSGKTFPKTKKTPKKHPVVY